jgi:hypothetical protein
VTGPKCVQSQPRTQSHARPVRLPARWRGQGCPVGKGQRATRPRHCGRIACQIRVPHTRAQQASAELRLPEQVVAKVPLDVVRSGVIIPIHATRISTPRMRCILWFLALFIPAYQYAERVRRGVTALNSALPLRRQNLRPRVPARLIRTSLTSVESRANA